MRKKIVGIPIVSILGALCAVSFAYMGYILYTNPLVGMDHPHYSALRSQSAY